MAELDISKTTTPTEIADYTETAKQTDGLNVEGETFWDNPDFPKFFGKYNATNKIKAGIKAFATWVTGLGYTTESARDQVILDNITGTGKETFDEILWNMLVIKKVNGDSYSNIMRNAAGSPINVKPINPTRIRVVYTPEGIIDRYEEISGKGTKAIQTISTDKILHLMNDRVADSIHGDSVIQALEWNVEAQEEARRAHRKLVKNNGVVRIIEIDSEDTTKIAAFKVQWKEALERGDILLIPKNIAEAKDWHGTLNTQEVLSWLNYLDDEHHQILGLPKIIGGASGEIEGDSKVSYLAFEPVYKRAIRDLEKQIWNQLAIRIKFNLPPSLKNTLADNENKNSSQVGFQQGDTTAGVGA